MPKAPWPCANGCGKKGSFNCDACRTVRYCGPECQRAHWVQKGGHKAACKAARKAAQDKSGNTAHAAGACTGADAEPVKPTKNPGHSEAVLMSGAAVRDAVEREKLRSRRRTRGEEEEKEVSECALTYDSYSKVRM